MGIRFGTAAAIAMIALEVTAPSRRPEGQAQPLALRPAPVVPLLAAAPPAFRAGAGVACNSSERRLNVRAFRRWDNQTSEPPEGRCLYKVP